MILIKPISLNYFNILFHVSCGALEFFSLVGLAFSVRHYLNLRKGEKAQKNIPAMPSAEPDIKEQVVINHLPHEEIPQSSHPLSAFFTELEEKEDELEPLMKVLESAVQEEWQIPGNLLKRWVFFADKNPSLLPKLAHCLYINKSQIPAQLPESVFFALIDYVATVNKPDAKILNQISDSLFIYFNIAHPDKRKYKLLPKKIKILLIRYAEKICQKKTTPLHLSFCSLLMKREPTVCAPAIMMKLIKKDQCPPNPKAVLNFLRKSVGDRNLAFKIFDAIPFDCIDLLEILNPKKDDTIADLYLDHSLVRLQEKDWALFFTYYDRMPPFLISKCLEKQKGGMVFIKKCLHKELEFTTGRQEVLVALSNFPKTMASLYCSAIQNKEDMQEIILRIQACMKSKTRDLFDGELVYLCHGRYKKQLSEILKVVSDPAKYIFYCFEKDPHEADCKICNKAFAAASPIGQKEIFSKPNAKINALFEEALAQKTMQGDFFILAGYFQISPHEFSGKLSAIPNKKDKHYLRALMVLKHLSPLNAKMALRGLEDDDFIRFMELWHRALEKNPLEAHKSIVSLLKDDMKFLAIHFSEEFEERCKTRSQTKTSMLNYIFTEKWNYKNSYWNNFRKYVHSLKKAKLI